MVVLLLEVVYLVGKVVEKHKKETKHSNLEYLQAYRIKHMLEVQAQVLGVHSKILVDQPLLQVNNFLEQKQGYS